MSEGVKVSCSVDVGGTFTDCTVIRENGELVITKTNTTPHNFAEGIEKSVKLTNVDGKDINNFVHGSTIIINCLTERKGAKVGLITTDGFRDVLEIGRANRPDLYNTHYEKPEPFIPRYLRKEVIERVDHNGKIVYSLNKEEVFKILEFFVSEKVDAIAVCFLHSYANPDNEILCGKIIESKTPDIPFTLSHQISPEWREYERTSTTVLNSYCLPVSIKYIDSLKEKLEGLGITNESCTRTIMQSNGGTFSFDQAKKKPILCCESGPVAGVMAASIIGKAIGEEKIISLDFGGTTTKASLIDGGEPRIITDYFLGHDPKLAKFPIMVPTIDIVEAGSGGGSYAWINELGALKVGPYSQGANPGPACYNLGGDKATVSDCDLLLGRLNPDYFCGGDVKISPEKSKEVIDNIRKKFDERIGLDEMANGIVRLADSNMMQVIKLVSVRRGYDTRDFTVIASGGAGPLHAGSISQFTNVKRIIIPRHPGVFSSYGMLLTDLRRDYVHTKIVTLDSTLDDPKIVSDIYHKMEDEAMKAMVNEEKVDLSQRKLVFRRFGDCRYKGQEHTVKIALPGDRDGQGGYEGQDMEGIRKRFHDAHEKEFAFALRDTDMEIVNFHILALLSKEVKIEKMSSEGTDIQKALKGERMVYYHGYGRVKTRIYERDVMPPNGEYISGPLIVEEKTATTLVAPNQKLKVDEFGFLHIEDRPEDGKLKELDQKLNKFSVEIIKDCLISISEEMFISTQRTSMSTIIYEVLDFATGISDAKGRLISQGNGVTFFIGLLEFNIKAVLAKYGDDIQEGDVFLNNDPYTGGGTHLSDVSVVSPVFHEGQLVAFVANKAHWTEVGGTNPGSWSTNSTEIYQEGLRFPCIRICTKGVMNNDLVDLIRVNVRTPKESIGDMLSQIGSLKVAKERVSDIIRRYGFGLYHAAIEKILEEGEFAAREGMKKLPKAEFEATDFIDDDGIGNGPFELKCKVSITEDEFVVDYSGTVGQVPGPINCGRDGTVTACRVVFKALVNPDLSISNEGIFRPLKVIIPPKTIFSAEEPSPVSTYWETSIMAADVLWRAMAKVIPEKLSAGHFLSVCGVSAFGNHQDTGDLFILVEPSAGGWGAGKNRDGTNSLVCIGDGETYVIPVEVCEKKYGVRVNRYQLDTVDSRDGAGKFRGGRGLLREYEVMCDKLWLTSTFGRHKYLPWGFECGNDGGPNYVRVIYKNPQQKQERFGKCAQKPLEKGDRIQLFTGTGGGWGHPFERVPEKIVWDVKNEYITLRSAEEDYGVIVDTKEWKVVGETEARKKYRIENKKE